MKETPGCSCEIGPKMVFACSGAADVGGIADLAARQLQREREALMCCTAAIAADATEIVGKARQAEKIFAIDGCAEVCARKILERAGFEGFAALSLDRMEMRKGSTPATPERVAEVVRRGREVLVAEESTGPGRSHA